MDACRNYCTIIDETTCFEHTFCIWAIFFVFTEALAVKYASVILIVMFGKMGGNEERWDSD